MGWCLVVLAAGKGSRFGGPKQLAPVGPKDEPLLILSLQDAIAAGAQSAVIVTRPELAEPLRHSCAQFLGGRMTVTFAFQEIDDLPHAVAVERTKPWGTGHALWTARSGVNTPFAVINADDYYGSTSMRLVGEAATQLAASEAALIAYRLENTLSESGGVSRAVCDIVYGNLAGLDETYDIRNEGGSIVGRREAGVSLRPDTPVSINLWAFHPSIFTLIERQLEDFLNAEDLHEAEIGLPQTIQALMKAGDLRVRVKMSPDSWLGLTYAEDLPHVRAALSAVATG